MRTPNFFLILLFSFFSIGCSSETPNISNPIDQVHPIYYIAKSDFTKVLKSLGNDLPPKWNLSYSMLSNGRDKLLLASDYDFRNYFVFEQNKDPEFAISTQENEWESVFDWDLNLIGAYKAPGALRMKELTYSVDSDPRFPKPSSSETYYNLMLFRRLFPDFIIIKKTSNRDTPMKTDFFISKVDAPYETMIETEKWVHFLKQQGGRIFAILGPGLYSYSYEIWSLKNGTITTIHSSRFSLGDDDYYADLIDVDITNETALFIRYPNKEHHFWPRKNFVQLFDLRSGKEIQRAKASTKGANIFFINKPTVEGLKFTIAEPFQK